MESQHFQDYFTLTLRQGHAQRFYIRMTWVTVLDAWGNVCFKSAFGKNKEISLQLPKGTYNISVSCLGGLWGKRVESQLVLRDYQQPQCDIAVDMVNRNYAAQFIPFMAYLTTPFDYRLRLETSDAAQPVQENPTRRRLAAALVALAACVIGFAGLFALNYGLSSNYAAYPGSDLYLEGTDAFTKVTYEFLGYTIADIVFWVLALAAALLLLRVAGILRKRRVRTNINPEVRKPYCLYLRSFNSDQMTSKEISSILKPGQTEESMLVDIFNEIAPVYAIGCPNEKYLPKGADRIYVSDDQWKDKVRELAQDAEVILLRLGETDGFWWEVEHCFQNIALQKLVFIIPATHNVDIISMLYAKLMALGVIDKPVNTDISRKSKTHISGFLYFDENNRPVFQKLEHSRLASSMIPLGEKIAQLLRSFLVRFHLVVPEKNLARRAVAAWVAMLLATGLVVSVKKSHVDTFQQNRYPREIISVCQQEPALAARLAAVVDPETSEMEVIAKTADQGAMLLSEEDALAFYNLQWELISVISVREAEILYDICLQEKPQLEEALKVMLTLGKQYFYPEYYTLYLSYVRQCATLYFENWENIPQASQADCDDLALRAAEKAPGWTYSDTPTQSEKKEFLLALFAAGAEMYQENPERIDIIRVLLIQP